jgi:type II secretory pathway pseudopilin PulG
MSGLVIWIIVIILVCVFFNRVRSSDARAKQKGENLLVQKISGAYIEKMLPHIEAHLKEDSNGRLTFNLDISDAKILAEIQQEMKKRYPTVPITIKSEDSTENDNRVNDFRATYLAEDEEDEGVSQDIIYQQYYGVNAERNRKI